jgi:hypothetical protein
MKMRRTALVIILAGLAHVPPAPVARAQGIGFGQTIGTIPDGAMLNVAPVASADRRYVRMTVNPQFVGVQGFTTWTVPAAVGGGGFGFNGGGFAGGGNFGGAYGGWNGPVSVEPAYAGGLGGMPPPQTYNALGPLSGAIQRSTRAGWRGGYWP